jgi:hypothetical protein
MSCKVLQAIYLFWAEPENRWYMEFPASTCPMGKAIKLKETKTLAVFCV